MKQFRETNIEKRIWITLGVFLAILIVVLLNASCSTTEQLTEPDKKDLVIIHTDDNYVFAVPACEIKPIYWPKADTLKVWSVLLNKH